MTAAHIFWELQLGPWRCEWDPLSQEETWRIDKLIRPETSQCLLICSSLLRCRHISNVESKLRRGFIQNKTGSYISRNRINSLSHDTTALQLNMFWEEHICYYQQIRNDLTLTCETTADFRTVLPSNEQYSLFSNLGDSTLSHCPARSNAAVQIFGQLTSYLTPWCNSPSGPRPPKCRGFMITLSLTHHTW
jgi:hypothetical protein